MGRANRRTQVGIGGLQLLGRSGRENLPPVVLATFWRAAASTGTGVVWPCTTTVPEAVPNAIVETGTPAALAALAALATLASGRPSVVIPSDSMSIKLADGSTYKADFNLK